MQGPRQAPRTVLRIAGATLGYDGPAVLEDIDLELRAGELWFLLGPNGSGKSTLLRALLGELAPRRGRIDLDARFADRSAVGFVPQRCDLNPTLSTTVREFVLLGLVGLRVPRRERRARLAEALERVGLDGRERADYGSLSGGQRQRALVARALVRRPAFLILDEPTAGLDAPTRESLLETIESLHRSGGLTTLVVTHNLATAGRHATHVALCDHGRLVSGPAAAMLVADRLAAAYGRPVPAPLLAGRGEGEPHVG